jgi:hypothetical protein
LGFIKRDKKSELRSFGGDPEKQLFTPMIVIRVYMEYAHIAGYAGEKIYRGDERKMKIMIRL